MLALSDDPQQETAWARGASKEQQVAEALGKRVSDDVVVVHDRRIPGTRVNIDHLAVTPNGVWVIDAKRHKGKVAVSRPLFGRAKLTIAGRDKTPLIEGLAGQVARVGTFMDVIAADVPVHGALCFVDADLPLLGTLTFDGYALLYPKALAKRLNAPGPVDREQRKYVVTQLAVSFPPA